MALRNGISSPAAPLTRRWLIARSGFETLITAWGAGYLRRGDLALTRWSDDPIAGLGGAWLVLRDQTRGLAWSATPLPLRPPAGPCVVRVWPTAVVFEREEHGIASRLAVAHAGDLAELRVLTVENYAAEPRALDVTAWTEPVLARWAADAAHPGFSKLFVQTDAHSEAGALLASRRPRGRDERFPVLAAALSGPGRLEWDTDRARFIGRGHDASDPRALEPGATLSGTAGSVLDPVLALRRTFALEPGQRSSFAFALAVADDRDAALALAARAVEPESARAHIEAACAGEPAERLALPPRAMSSARPSARVTSADGSGDGLSPAAATGRFTPDGYEFEVRADALPPRPWVNVLANERFGTLVSERGAACTWDVNSRERRLTPWSNDAVSDPHGEALYLRDDETFALIPPQPGPVDDTGAFDVTHGLGFSRWRRAAHGLALETTLWVDRVDPVQCCRVRIRETQGRARRLSLHAYRQLVLGTLAHESGRRIAVRAESLPDLGGPGTCGALLTATREDARGTSPAAFALAFGPPRAAHAFTADRAAFLGAPGTPRAPAALESRAALDGQTGEVEHPCFAQQVSFALAAGAEVELLLVLGAGEAAVARRIARELAGANAAARSLERVRQHWSGLCSRLRVSTPEPALDPLLPGWLLYQTIACRLWGRTAFYQSGGAFGFRDQLQDALALLPFAPELARAQLLLHARHQFVEGDVLHWWHPPAGRGLRTRFADDLAWLPWAVAEYVAFTGDRAVLAEPVPYRAARALEPGEDEAFLDTRETSPVESLYEHAARALDRALTRGVHDLPLFGTGDWNDGMNRVGREGRGESVWMGFFLVDVIRRFAPLADHEGDAARATHWREADARLVAALERHGWDGAWYRRGWYDDGAPLGSSDSDECRIDALAQSWAVLSGAAPRARAEAAMDAVERQLVSEPDGLIRLLTPPFDRTLHDPGYIKGYVRGVRENGGQYTHAALWVVRALAQLGRRDRAARLLAMLSPVTRAATPGRRAVYGLEPYVVAADVYGEPPHVSRGGWSWYTGSAGWMLRVALESVLGVTVEGGMLRVQPCIPDAWPGYSLAWRIPGSESVVELEVENPTRCSARVVAAELDGEPLELAEGVQVPLPSDGRTHALRVTLGA